jgi:hypothetical protein
MIQRQIFLDESKENQPFEGFTIVENEIEFLQANSAQMLWVRGQVCNFARAVCKARKLKVTEVESPRSRLRPILGEVVERIKMSLVVRALEIVENYNPQTLAELLYFFTHDDFWTQPVTLEHAARFLTIEIKPEFDDLAETQRKFWLKAVEDRNLKKIYTQKFDERENFLHKWLFDETTRQNLGEFPLALTEKHAVLLSDEIGRRLRMTEGAAVEDFPQKTLNKKIYAKAIIDYFSHNKGFLTADRIARIASLLSSVERARLEKLLPQSDITPLSAFADFQTALDWTTEKYLPFRAAQIETGACEEADVLAASFADWLLENYPKMTNLDRETSPINLRTFYLVKNLLESGFWVLWTVVDGLNYPNHQKLLQLLGEKSANLRVAENSPVFAVLPTITEKAKFGLTSGKFPSEDRQPKFDPHKTFLKYFPDGVYAESEGKNTLLKGLKRENPTVCYWNYLEIDKCFHDHSNLIFLNHDIDKLLRGLADDINQLVLLSGNNLNRVAVVICSDHGQITSNCSKLEFDVGNRKAHGRTILEQGDQIFEYANSAFVKTNNRETVCLNPTSFRLREPTIVALGSGYFVDLKANDRDGAIGVHGGLFPEEVVVGLAALMREPQRKIVSATVGGNGETGRSGMLILTIDNPNSVTINPLSMKIENLEFGSQGELLLGKVAAHRAINFEIPIEKFPVPTDGEEFEIKGVLNYEFFDDGTKAESHVSGRLICKSLYAAKNPSLLNRFKK